MIEDYDKTKQKHTLYLISTKGIRNIFCKIEFTSCFVYHVLIASCSSLRCLCCRSVRSSDLPSAADAAQVSALASYSDLVTAQHSRGQQQLSFVYSDCL